MKPLIIFNEVLSYQELKVRLVEQSRNMVISGVHITNSIIYNVPDFGDDWVEFEKLPWYKLLYRDPKPIKFVGYDIGKLVVVRDNTLLKAI